LTKMFGPALRLTVLFFGCAKRFAVAPAIVLLSRRTPGDPRGRARMKIFPAAISIAALATVGAAPASKPACASDPRVAAAAGAWKARAQQPPLAIDLADAPCFRNALLARLAPQLGPVIGYKVGVWTAAARASFHVHQPVVGVLLRDMIVPEGRPIPINFAFAPMAEADFLLVVRDAGINEARTRDEAYRHIRGYRPFIELPDNHYPAPVSADIGRVAALDVNARSGVMGAEVALPPTAAGLAALSGLSVEAVVAAPGGTHKDSAKALESLGDPVEIALVARDLLREEGIRLKAGDVISIGTLTPPHPPVAGEIFTVRYRVGHRTSEIRARFTG
jgi:2-keto-4-pentenoate hydratase